MALGKAKPKINVLPDTPPSDVGLAILADFCLDVGGAILADLGGGHKKAVAHTYARPASDGLFMGEHAPVQKPSSPCEA